MRIPQRIKQVEHARLKKMSFELLCKIHPYFKQFKEAISPASDYWHEQLLDILGNNLANEQSAALRIAPQFYSSTGDIKECVELAYMLIDEVYNAEGED